jgi:hypothetical protein
MLPPSEASVTSAIARSSRPRVRTTRKAKFAPSPALEFVPLIKPSRRTLVQGGQFGIW